MFNGIFKKNKSGKDDSKAEKAVVIKPKITVEQTSKKLKNAGSQVISTLGNLKGASIKPTPSDSSFEKEEVQKDLPKTSPDNFRESFAKTSTVEAINDLLETAYEYRASDIHIDPQNEEIAIRLRVDGMLQEIARSPRKSQSEIITRIKIMANMRTDEHQAAQEGRFRTTLKSGVNVDVRVSIVPTYYGENVVLRLLSDKAEEFTLESLGFSKSNQEKLEHAIRKPYGMILATGPTGSGKTTTLYTLVKMLNTQDRSIITIEDPIEYAIDGIIQIQTNPRMGLTFANGLRSILRQDPNIIMVGEIRDSETAGIAVNTSLTGHLLLSTLHTNDAATIMPRLLDLSIEPYLIASTVNAAIGQRLVRKICVDCKVERSMTGSEARSLQEALPGGKIDPHAKVYSGKGCDSCNDTGFKGRVGIHEVLVIDKPIRDAILRKASAGEISELAMQAGMTPMIEDGLIKALSGITSIEEVLRTLHE